MTEEPNDVPDRLQDRINELRSQDRGRPDDPPQPGPGQESVWEYPRPPRLERDARRVRVDLKGVTLADTTDAYRVLETASPPTFYLPPEDVRTDLLEPSARRTLCEWKGGARHWHARVEGRLVENVAWSYTEPWHGFEEIAGYLAFYPGRVDAARVGDEKVRPQPGEFYGGWITSEIVGPFKGEPGTEGW